MNKSEPIVIRFRGMHSGETTERKIERVEVCDIVDGGRPYFRIVYVDGTERTIQCDDPDVGLQIAAAVGQPS